MPPATDSRRWRNCGGCSSPSSSTSKRCTATRPRPTTARRRCSSSPQRAPRDDFAARIGTAASRQTQHGQVGDALAAALAQQATPPAPRRWRLLQRRRPRRLRPAPRNRRTAQAKRRRAARQTRKKPPNGSPKRPGSSTGRRSHGPGGRRRSTMPPSAPRPCRRELEPALEDQLAALDHLQNALQALQPPSGQEDRGDGQSDQQQATPQREQGAEEERMSQRQALKRLQAIRDREAQRQRRRANATQPAPVEKDW